MPLNKHPRDGRTGERPLELEEMPGYWVRRATQQVRAYFTEECGSEAGITPEQYTIMCVVEREEAIDQTSLAKAASLDLATTGNIVRRLVERGWLHRQKKAGDGRAWELALTAESIEILDETRQKGKRVRDRFFKDLTHEESQEFLRLVRIIVEGR